MKGWENIHKLGILPKFLSKILENPIPTFWNANREQNVPGYGTLNQGLSLRTFARASVLVPYKMFLGSSGRASETVRIPHIAQLINIDISICNIIRQ